jgi:DNA-binding MarR family transcriptional regulator
VRRNKRPCVSPERSITRPGDVEVSPELSADEIRLQINVRLRPEDLDIDLTPLRRRGQNAPSHDELCALACRIYDARREREKMLGSKLFGEPGWDMMLALYCLPARGERLTVTALALASGAKPTTGLRWQEALIEEGLIERSDDEKDKRRTFVRLTEKGRQLLEDYLLWLYHVDPKPVGRAGRFKKPL